MSEINSRFTKWFTLGILTNSSYLCRHRCPNFTITVLLLVQWLGRHSSFSDRQTDTHTHILLNVCMLLPKSWLNLSHYCYYCQICFTSFLLLLHHSWGFSGGSAVKNPLQCKRCRRHMYHPWVRKIPWRRPWQPTPVFLPGESHGQRSLVGYSPQGHRRARQNLATKQQHNTYIMLCIPYIYLVLKYQIILAASRVAPATLETGFLKKSLWLNIYLRSWCCRRQTLPISWTENGWDTPSLLPNACVLRERCTPSWLPHVRTQKSWVYQLG